MCRPPNELEKRQQQSRQGFEEKVAAAKADGKRLSKSAFREMGIQVKNAMLRERCDDELLPILLEHDIADEFVVDDQRRPSVLQTVTDLKHFKGAAMGIDPGITHSITGVYGADHKNGSGINLEASHNHKRLKSKEFSPLD